MSTAYKTAELRWFTKIRPAQLADWFDGLPAQRTVLEERTDEYLPTGSGRVGIKIREGRLEVKVRSARQSWQPDSGELEGLLECWTKRGFELPPGEVSANAEAYLQVHKTRKTVIVTWPGPDYHKPGTDSPEGCQVELTHLSVAGEQWYTFGLEWPDDQWEAQTGAWLAGLLAGRDVRKAESMGYAAFLRRFEVPV